MSTSLEKATSIKQDTLMQPEATFKKNILDSIRVKDDCCRMHQWLQIKLKITSAETEKLEFG